MLTHSVHIDAYDEKIFTPQHPTGSVARFGPGRLCPQPPHLSNHHLAKRLRRGGSVETHPAQFAGQDALPLRPMPFNVASGTGHDDAQCRDGEIIAIGRSGSPELVAVVGLVRSLLSQSSTISAGCIDIGTIIIMHGRAPWLASC